MRLEDTAPQGGRTLIILDPVSRLMGADTETDNAAVTQVTYTTYRDLSKSQSNALYVLLKGLEL